MAVWIEIRCDKRSRGGQCYSDLNEGPMALASTAKTVNMLVELTKQAVSEGWFVTPGKEIHCPSCKGRKD